MLGVRLPKDMEAHLGHISELSKRSKSSIVKEALEKYFEDMEDYYIVLDRLEKHKKSGSKTYSLEEIGKEFGLDDEE